MSCVRRALISVSDKSGVVEFARALQRRGAEILSTGGTARALAGHGVAVTEVSAFTGFPELMDGRVKTLHPRIHGGILGRRGIDDAAMRDHDIPPIDLVAVNLYPFEATVAREDCTFDQAIENIDIGGPTLLRAAAKNHAHVAVVVDTHDYRRVLDAIDEGALSAALRRELAAKAFAHTARYDGAIANYLGARCGDDARPEAFPRTLSLQFDKLQDMRYGENPHQSAAFYADPDPAPGTVAGARQLQGKALSFNNVADADAAIACVQTFAATPACVIVKHANPCGVAVAAEPAEAYRLAFATDPTSAFGGIIAFNQTLDAATAREIISNQFVEVIAAPAVDDDAVSALADKRNVRLLVYGTTPARGGGLDFRRVCGGLLVQSADDRNLEPADVHVASARQPSPQELQDLLFAWKVVKYVKSNAIVYARNGRTVGIGAGQMSRVDSARIAVAKAQAARLEVSGSVMASDAFFPFRDGIDSAAEAGVRAVIQPGGSRRDEEVIRAADDADMAMVFTGIRHFRH